jgi:hypothetical protein
VLFKFAAMLVSVSVLSLFSSLAASDRPGQIIPLQIEHTPLVQFTWGEAVEIKASVQGEPEGVNFFYGQAGVAGYQVRPLAKAEDGSYVLIFDTTALTVVNFEYYLEAVRGGAKAMFPPGAPGELVHVGGQGQSPPQVPADLPTPQAEEAKFQFPVSVTGSGLATLYQSQSQPGVAGSQSSGNVRVAAQYQGKSRWAANVDSNFLYAGAPPPGLKAFDLSNLKVSLTRGNMALRAGDIDLNESEYTVFGLGRRGFDFGFDDQKLYVRAFAAGTQQVQGFAGFGFPAESVRVMGAAAGYKLFQDALWIKGVFVTGKDSPGHGVNVGCSPSYAPRQGSVASLIQETHLFQQALNFRAEIAASSYDGDLKDDKGRAKDGAYQLSSDFRLGSFTGGAKFKHIGRDFNSIGLLFIANDREGLEANLGFMKGKVSLQGMYSRERDNIRDDLARPTTKGQNGQVVGILTLSSVLTLNAGYRLTSQSTFQGDVTAGLQDASTRELTAGVSWSPWPSTSVNCTAVNSEIESKNNPSSDTRALTFNAGLSFRAGETWTFNPSLTWSRSVYPALDSICVSLNANVATELSLVRQILSLALYATGNRAEMPGVGPTSLVNVTAGANLQLGNLIKFKTIVVSLKGSTNRTTMSGQTITDTRVFLQGDLAF